MIIGMPFTTDPIALQLLASQQDTPLLVALFDAGDQLRFANAAFRQSYGLGPDEEPTWAEMLLRNYAEGVGALIETTDTASWLVSARSRRGKLPFRAFEADLCDGRWVWMTETLRTDGWMLCVASDITELRTSERVLRQARDVAVRAAQTDVLTGISNRAHILQLLEQSIEQQSLDRDRAEAFVGKNMNRLYPGKADGTQTERISWAITKQVIEKWRKYAGSVGSQQ